MPNSITLTSLVSDQNHTRLYVLDALTQLLHDAMKGGNDVSIAIVTQLRAVGKESDRYFLTSRAYGEDRQRIDICSYFNREGNLYPAMVEVRNEPVSKILRFPSRYLRRWALLVKSNQVVASSGALHGQDDPFAVVETPLPFASSFSSLDFLSQMAEFPELLTEPRDYAQMLAEDKRALPRSRTGKSDITSKTRNVTMEVVETFMTTATRFLMRAAGDDRILSAEEVFAIAAIRTVNHNLMGSVVSQSQLSLLRYCIKVMRELERKYP